LLMTPNVPTTSSKAATVKNASHLEPFSHC
jgi:hypothetical protein